MIEASNLCKNGLENNSREYLNVVEKLLKLRQQLFVKELAKINDSASSSSLADLVE